VITVVLLLFSESNEMSPKVTFLAMSEVTCY